MKKARVIFKDNTPYSLDFEDFYFNSQEGVEESRFVYTEAFEWEECESFIIAETGFGIGLNFFLTLQNFLKTKKRPKRLFYVSVEGFYLEPSFLREAYKRLGIYEEIKELLEQFLLFYPKCAKGIYRFYFKDCFLDLVFDDISVLKRLEFEANIWYLDGFSPSKNSLMFDENTLFEIARLSKLNATILSFSSSSFLQKNLKHCGFDVAKVKGFRKREMVRAFLKHKKQMTNREAYFQKVSAKFENKKVAIIGAGISGALLAYELSLRGFEVEIFEKNATLYEGASSNESGILSSLILNPQSALGNFSLNAFVEASRFYRQILDLKLKGVYEFAYTLQMQQRFFTQKDNAYFQIAQNKAFLDYGGHIYPKEILSSLFEKAGVKIYFNHHFSHYERENETFNLIFKNASKRCKFGILIYTLGADAKDFLHYEAMLLSRVRGQLTHLKPFFKTEFPLSSKAYICPPKSNLQVIGATYDRLNTNPKGQRKDDKENLEKIKEFLKGDEEIEILGSRVGFRSYSSDRFCIAGAAYDEEFYKQNYKALLWHKNKPQISPQNIPNLYLSLAQGSRAFSSSVLCARYLCALINDEPLGFYADFIPHIHPARFLIRKLKKGLLE
ncbi:bifunctional tRNA (5-methylaminomethyl-2-thiouridine)(34)-methyltransferase MnmD/FAD-dependent 5-carboxymethylaminomethyl-2-thiouridine(34) oxidoreductase MnmC [Campylobacter upsaliensis]|uniref:Bifunctional tRNA (5-methylaminomethyl-2-thiouridine)(34)-methyltransferase MnmD/FAD-dependent 5-carboxymethylaminomethyl-2-thiouridine(34) oxidoreductase MnmC n=1 Tax=Campylobacter upsaliensis TaxID=28080 RepID=A0A5M1DYQ5_CAMUP|nr:bifunctional tRNA (5-methylaminomethyl-2-thiouridine)(34)-methyltransferase MnmD/FAD-dependent 5-carboxymethylaminomethyl-2-thiouridine(34) oxidoreductase MnmC [Campylobacter upsaliensis]EAI2899885.1 bifunctional tRNA (5-methylaminomethyl-2-thiouridine)(34)-methyltransferase MnmD/FAD-dependent 5-carboxymethylaminomethyl-2-thiouridine(34) oxidoreductase MnmC [Campylobacter upsaliensis]EAI9945211.1 bifunctional tRNA (5-methylaminomethyl-2-thiouridine)(34)-methyltransferase MnmD/FAD-dependent 5-c